MPETRRGDLADADRHSIPRRSALGYLSRLDDPRDPVEEVVLDSETGLYRTDYADVSEALFNEGAAIFNRSQESDSR